MTHITVKKEIYSNPNPSIHLCANLNSLVYCHFYPEETNANIRIQVFKRRMELWK